MADTASSSPSRCASCQKEKTTEGTELKQCSRCHVIRYCSRDCQKADWKKHKKSCGSNANAQTSSSSSSGFKSTKPIMESLLGLKSKTWLHNRPETETFTLLIDSYRMRVEDDYKFRGEIDDDSLYGQGDPTKGFRKFLVKAEKRGGVLPPWWTEAKREQCIAKGNEQGPWSSLHYAVEKPDIQEHYNDNVMPMKLRMLAEEILGSSVMAH